MHEQENHSKSGRVTAVFTTFNSSHVIGRALASLPDFVHAIVIDNNSRDDTVEIAQAARPSAEVIKLPSNRGFGRGCNEGLRRVKTDYAVVINPDLFVSPDCLAICIDAADTHKDVALLGAWQEVRAATETSRTDIEYADAISGAFMFMRMSAFAKIGLFDENIFMYFEDNDICLRTLESGYKIAHSMTAIFSHVGAGSTQKNYDSICEKARIWGQSCAYFAEKYRNHPAGKAVRRKIVHYHIKYAKNLILNKEEALIYKARLRGWREYNDFGREIMFKNKFIY